MIFLCFLVVTLIDLKNKKEIKLEEIKLERDKIALEHEKIHLQKLGGE